MQSKFIQQTCKEIVETLWNMSAYTRFFILSYKTRKDKKNSKDSVIRFT